MAAYAAVASLMNNIEQISNHPRLSKSFNNIQIQTLLQKARFLLDFIETINYVGGNKEVEDLEREIALSAHAAEDVIESLIVDQIHAYKANKKAISLFMVNVDKHVRDMDALIVKANELLKAKKASKECEEQRPTHSTPLLENGDTTASMVGLDDELIRLLHELTGHQSSRHTISIVGMGGIGKTTLAKTVYAHSIVVQHFDIRAWATISQHYDEVDIFSQLLSCLGQSSSGSVDELGVRLHKTLIGRRYLVVLDDIWSVEAWDKVRRYFPDDGNSSRLILTTRLSNIANVCSSSCLKMNLLDEDKSWKLFCEKTLFPYKDDPPQLERVGKDIVNLCKGLALLIVVIGGLLLKSPRTVGYWEDVANNMKSMGANNSNEKQESLDVISSSYNHLPPHLKPCFLYMGLFEKDSVTRVSTISRLWVAEGFIRPYGDRVLEEIAEGYLNDLVDRNLISVRSRRYNGKIGSCGIHDLLRDLCIKVAKQQDFLQASHIVGNTYQYQRIVNFPLSRYVSRRMNIKFPLTRSLYMRRTRNDSFEGRGRATTCKLLRVLSNAYCVRTSPEILYENVNLRYLTYTQIYAQSMWQLPSSVTHIWNLQTLIISPVFSISLLEAPSEIWKMRQLRHFEFPRIYLPSPMEGQDGSLENLQTLTTAVNLGLSKDVCKMIPKIKKLRLVYDCELKGYNDIRTECVCNMDGLHKLESLKMEIKSPLQLPKLAFPSSLLKLSMTGVELGNWNELRVVGLLPQLQILNLERLDVKDSTSSWTPAKEEFRSLKLLKIEGCVLYMWEIADWLHFQVLEKLILKRLGGLREISLAVGEIPTLELIRVDNCNEISLAISAMRIKEEQLETQVDDDAALRIEVWLYGKSKMESFKERVETEQLTLDHIHLEGRIK